jgi:hypothetical protein
MSIVGALERNVVGAEDRIGEFRVTGRALLGGRVQVIAS